MPPATAMMLCTSAKHETGSAAPAAPAGRTTFDAGSADTRQLRRAMGHFATGVTVVTTCGPDGRLEGVTANSFSTVSLDPPLVLWSLRRNAGSFANFSEAPHFAVNVLGVEQRNISQHFASPSLNKLAEITYEAGIGGCPLLPGTIAHFECSRETAIDAGDHVIFIGRVVRASFRDGEPLVFSGGAYKRAVALPHV